MIPDNKYAYLYLALYALASLIFTAMCGIVAYTTVIVLAYGMACITGGCVIK